MFALRIGFIVSAQTLSLTPQITIFHSFSTRLVTVIRLGRKMKKARNFSLLLHVREIAVIISKTQLGDDITEALLHQTNHIRMDMKHEHNGLGILHSCQGSWHCGDQQSYDFET